MCLETILAYFDPGAGSLLMQMLVGGTAGLMVFLKYMWETYGRAAWRRRR